MTPTRSHSQRAKLWILSIRMENGGRHGRRTAHLGVRSTAISSSLLFADPYPSRAVELSPSYLMDHRMRRTPLPSSFSFVAHDISLLFFPCLLTGGLDLVTTLSTNACLKLGLLDYIFLFLEIGMCIATDGRKMDAVCCGHSLDIFSTAVTVPSPLSLSPSLPWHSSYALPSVLYRPTQLYVCAQYNALARSRTSNNNVKPLYAVDG